MKNLIIAAAMASVCLSFQFAASAQDLDQLNGRLESSANIIKQIESAPDGGIPNSILRKAKCVAVIPSVIKGAFVVGASYGQGVVTCRTEHGWSGPVFIRLAGASFGFQIGGQATDLVLIAVNDRGFQSLLKSKVKLGADASIAAGPVGRNASAATDVVMNAELLSYSRNKGIFAGVDLNGTDVSQNQDDTNLFYGGKPMGYREVLGGAVPVPPAARSFVSTVSKYFVEVR
jgi:lipid-binding SYLF domain-containing protein